jgi:N-acetylmuramoyl-L-alanine amidase
MRSLFSLVITFTMVIGSYTVFPTAQINAEAADSIQNANSFKLYCGNYDIDINGTGFIELPFPIEVRGNYQIVSIEDKDHSQTISNEEKKLLARLVHAEAKGEPYVGKVAVAAVVLNRVEHKQFPDTIKEVIFEKNAFEPVQNDSIHEPADNEAFKAVQEALVDQENDDGSLYFYNPDTATSDWILTREVIKTIGNHAFAI